MNVSRKTIGVLLLTAALVFVTACSSQGSGGESAAPESTPAATAAPAASEPPAPSSEGGGSDGGSAEQGAAEETIDMGGITITFADPWGRDLETLGQSDYNDRLIERVAEVEAKYNVNFEYVRGPETYWDDMTKAVAAGEPWGDIMFTFPWIAPGWIKAGVMKDVSNLGFNFDDDSVWDPLATAEGRYGDKQFMFGHRPVELNGGILYNKALFDRYGVEDPQTLYERGEWTFQKFEEIAKRLTDPSAGVYGFATTNSRNIFNLFELNNNAPLVNFGTSSVSSNFGDPGALAGYELIHRMLHVDKSWYFETEDYAALSQQFLEGKIAMFGAEKWVIEVVAAWSTEDFDYRWVVFPLGPNGTEHTMTAGIFLDFIPVNLDDDRAKKAIMVYDEVFKSPYPTPEEEYTAYAEALFVDEKSVELYVDTVLGRKYTATFIDKAGITDIINEFYRELKEGASTPAALVEKYKPLIEAAVQDGIYNQIVQ